MTEISYIFADISDILGYLDLFSNIAGVQPLICLFSSRDIEVWDFLEVIDQHLLQLRAETRMQPTKGFALM